MTVLADGGVRSGLDVVRMLALGAKGVLLGRAWAFALAARGEAGVAHVLRLIEAEMRVAMALTRLHPHRRDRPRHFGGGPMTLALFRIDPRDGVATALRDLDAGEALLGVTLAEPVAKGHKVALQPIAAGAPVVKFGFPIGRATRAIAPGEHVHTHNLATRARRHGRLCLSARAGACRGAVVRDLPRLSPRQRSRRHAQRDLGDPDGRLRPRAPAQKIAERAHARHAGRIDGVHAFAHPFGCSQLGDDLAGTRSILRRAREPSQCRRRADRRARLRIRTRPPR